jgi:glycosyltransferase involved in cell wall biosynthesis
MATLSERDSAAVAEPVAAIGRPLNVCIVAHLAFGSLSGTKGHIGGVEYQTSMLARWLAGRGHRVTMITWDEGQRTGTTIDNVKVIKLCREQDGWPGVRFVHPRWTSLVQALRAANADVYYQNCGEHVTGQVGMWCRAHGARFVFSVASNGDCDVELPFLTTTRERLLYRIGLRLADRVIAQTDHQRQMLRDGFGVEASVIALPGAAASSSVPNKSPRTRMVWIGRICEVKRPDRLLDLASECADLSFDLVGPAEDTPYARGVVERARTLANVRVHGALTRERIASLLEEAICLCCTSELEGFPNTFVEAWSREVPLLSTFDPGGLIARHRLGVVADAQGLPGALRDLIAHRNVWETLSDNAIRYFREHHAAEVVMPQFEAVFASMTEAS